MPLNIELLTNVRTTGSHTRSRCPACHESGGDRQGVHLRVTNSDGSFACAADPSLEHWQRIRCLVGLPIDKPELTAEAKRAYAIKKAGEEFEVQWKAALLASQRSKAESKRSSLVADFAWDEEELWNASPIRLEAPHPDDWRYLVELMPNDGLIWIGDKGDSGQERHHGCFRTRREWLQSTHCPGPRMAPSTFRHGPSRSLDAIEATNFLVVDLDECCGFKPVTEEDFTANKASGRAILRWLQEACGLTLRAVIDTGSKGYHAWFDRPPEEFVEQLRNLADGLGIDPGILNAHAAPLRLPGCVHEKTGRPAILKFISPTNH